MTRYQQLNYHIGGLFFLARDTFLMTVKDMKSGQLRVSFLFREMEEVGYKSLPIVLLVAFLIGMTMAMQSANVLNKYGILSMIPQLVTVSITRELGPLMTAIVVAGRVGASFTAELGTMKVSEEILALRTMAMNPISFLVVPRFLALLIMLPCLTVLADIMGIAGGFAISTTKLDLNPALYFANTMDSLVIKDILSGIFKSVVFALIIVIVGCYMAFIIEGGANQVGENTRSAVVLCLILIIFSDSVFTAMLYFLF